MLTARTNLAYALLSASIDEAVCRVPKPHQNDAREAVDNLLSNFSDEALKALTKNNGELSDNLPRHLSIKNVHLLSALSDLGLVLRSDHDALHYRWAHRDLTMMSMMAPALNQDDSTALEEIIDLARDRRWSLVLTNVPGYGRRRTEQFHRKSGRSLFFTEPYFTTAPWEHELVGTPWEGLDRFSDELVGTRSISGLSALLDQRHGY